MPVIRVDPRGEEPAEKLVAEIEAIEKKGGTVTGVVSLFNEHILIYTQPKREVRSDREVR